MVHSQYVVFRENISDIQDITHGVPQGSIFSPLVFLLFLYDLAGVDYLLHTVLFADDTSVFVHICSY